MLNPTQADEVADLARTGRGIDAIRLIRSWLGCPLKQAKDYYEIFVCGMFANERVKD